MALVAVAGRRRAYTVCTSVGQDGGWARIGSLGKVRIGSLGKVQSAWCNRTGSRAGWGSAEQLPPRPGGLQCSSLRGPGAPSGGGSHLTPRLVGRLLAGPPPWPRP